jgi:hypothetical protein
MKHCPRCRQDYEDWVSACADCGHALSAGTAAGSTTPVARVPDSRRACSARPPGSECVFSGLPEFAEPLALALADAGIPAFAVEAEPEEDDPENAGDLPEGFLDVLVPKERYILALWFVRGFEAAGGMGSEEDGGQIREPENPD